MTSMESIQPATTRLLEGALEHLRYVRSDAEHRRLHNLDEVRAFLEGLSDCASPLRRASAYIEPPYSEAVNLVSAGLTALSEMRTIARMRYRERTQPGDGNGKGETDLGSFWWYSTSLLTSAIEEVSAVLLALQGLTRAAKMEIFIGGLAAMRMPPMGRRARALSTIRTLANELLYYSDDSSSR